MLITKFRNGLGDALSADCVPVPAAPTLNKVWRIGPFDFDLTAIEAEVKKRPEDYKIRIFKTFKGSAIPAPMYATLVAKLKSQSKKHWQLYRQGNSPVLLGVLNAELAAGKWKRNAPGDIVQDAAPVYKSGEGYVKYGTRVAAAGQYLLYLPYFTGEEVLWHLDPPFNDNGRAWGIFVSVHPLGHPEDWVIELRRLPRTWTAGLVDNISDAWHATVEFVCGGITNSKLQAVRNAAGAVPEPHTQVVVAAWAAAAAVCGMTMPSLPTVSCVPQPPAPVVVPAPSWFEANQKYVIGGVVGLVALVAAKTLMQRR